MIPMLSADLLALQAQLPGTILILTKASMDKLKIQLGGMIQEQPDGSWKGLDLTFKEAA